MKFFKQNWIIIVCLLLIAAALPVGWVFSNNWNKSIKTSQETAAKQDLGKIKSGPVEYKLPSMTPGEPGLTLTAPPNARLTQWFTEERARISEQLDTAKTQASSFNRREHAELVTGLFPEPQSYRDGQLLAIDMVKRLVGEDGGPSAYEGLLQSVDAGEPLAAPILAQSLDDFSQSEEQRIQDETGAQITDEERKQITLKLIDRRLREYRRHARELSFYADKSIFFQGNAGATPPDAVPAQPPEIEECFVWQFDYWVYKDILDAVALANIGDDGRHVGIENAPVKRVVKINIDPLLELSGFGGSTPPPATRGNRGDPYGDPAGGDPYGDAPAEFSGAPAGEIPRDYSISVTGRASGPQNQTYDVREVELEVIVASKKIPALIDALSQTNFMTITGLAIEEVDSWAQLQQGLYYGPDNVVRVTLQIETIWLRDWTVPLMPDPIVTALGVIKPEPQTPEDDG